MKAALKKQLITWAILIPVVILLVEFQNWMKNQSPVCTDGSCARPGDYGLVINPFPDEIVPADAVTDQTNTFEQGTER